MRTLTLNSFILPDYLLDYFTIFMVYNNDPFLNTLTDVDYCPLVLFGISVKITREITDRTLEPSVLQPQ